MEEFTQMIDTYFLNYDLYEKEKISFECDYGELIFLKSEYIYLVKLKNILPLSKNIIV